MIDIPESEALVILSQPKLCYDCTWAPIKTQAYAMEAVMGLVDQSEQRIRQYIRLQYQSHPVVGSTTYLFTLFSQKITGVERIYQLEVRQYKKPIKSAHQLPHEHIGKSRVNGSDSWSTWGYDEAIAHFGSRTNIVFMPEVVHPNKFELR